MKKNFISLLLLLVLTLTSCGEYQRLLKSNDAELKYKKAIEYYDKHDYMRSATLFDAVATYFKGTELSESVLIYLARSYYGQKDYISAVEYFKTYYRIYSTGKFAPEAKYMVAYCYYKDSPDVRLDQTPTQSAIDAFQDFLNLFPENEKVQEANKYMDELNDKMAEKYLINAQLYYNLGNYMGNNYQSAIITAQNGLKKYPNNSHREDFGMLILNSKYMIAEQSVEAYKTDRFRDAEDEYYGYINEFPNGKHRKEAEKILRECKSILKE